MLHDEDTEKEAKKGKGDEMRHKEINRKRGKVPKDVHCVLQPKGKESRVRMIYIKIETSCRRV